MGKTGTPRPNLGDNPGNIPHLANHPRRCKAIKKWNGEQCKKWAMRGSDHCKTHGGSRGHKRKHKGVGVRHLPKFYRDVLTSTLEEAIDQLSDCAPHEAVSLYEELALTRQAASEGVALYSRAVEARARIKRADDPEKYDKLDNLCTSGSQLMVDALKQVEYFCTAIARIEAVSKDKLNIHTLHGAMRQVTRIMFEVCGEDNQHLAERFEVLVKEQVVLPNTGSSEGTDLLPGQLDDDVTSMDDTIPGPD